MVFQLVLWPHKPSFCINFYTMKSVKQLSIATQKQLIKSALRSSYQVCSIDLSCLISYPAAGLSAYCSRISFPSNLAEALFVHLQYGRTVVISGSTRTLLTILSYHLFWSVSRHFHIQEICPFHIMYNLLAAVPLRWRLPSCYRHSLIYHVWFTGAMCDR